MKKKRGPKSEPVDKLRTLSTLSVIDQLCPDVLKLEAERNKIWRWRKLEVAMSPSSLSLLCGRITRASALGGKEVATTVERAYKYGPDGQPIWDAFHPTAGQHAAYHFAAEAGIDCTAMTPSEAAAAVMKALVPPLWKLTVATSAVIHSHLLKLGESSESNGTDVHSLLVDALLHSAECLREIGLDPLLWATTIIDQIEYFPQPTGSPRKFYFEMYIFPAINPQ